MINRQQGQLRIGGSGPVIVGECPPEQSVHQTHQEQPKAKHRQRSNKAKRILSNIASKDRKSRNERKMRAGSLKPVLTEGLIIEESKITRQGSAKLTQLRPSETSHIVTAHKILKDINVEKFDKLIKKNKDSGRHWYHGLKDEWWWGMSDEQVRNHIVDLELQQKVDRDLKEKLKKEESNAEKLKKEGLKTEGSKIVTPKKEESRTIGEIVNDMTSKYNTELPKDTIKRISYIYPLNSANSFNIVSANHVKYLRHKHISENDNIEIDEVDWTQLQNLDWKEKRNVLIHPFLYQFASYESFMQNSRNFARLLATKHKIGGFDVADSDRISKIAVDLINKIDLIMVPSNFAKDVYIKSGVTIPVEILPHGIEDEFLTDAHIRTDNIEIAKLRKLKEGGNVLILYFLVHSGHRKGADLVKEVMKRVQKKFKNVYLVVKGKDKDYFSDIRSIYIESWMNDNDLISLYDTCDICLSPSRGGGFEMNALEAASRGLPTLVANGGCFLDLIDYFIPVNVSSSTTRPLPGNSIHIGLGHDIDVNDFEVKLVDSINRLDYWKDRVHGNIKEIREKYTWREVARILDVHLKNHGFIE